MVLKYSKTGDVNKAVLYEYTFEKPGVHTVDIVIDNSCESVLMDQVAIDAIDVVGTLQEKAAIEENPVLVIEEPKNYCYFSFDYGNKNHYGPQNVNLKDGKTTEKVIYFRVLLSDDGKYTLNVHNIVYFGGGQSPFFCCGGDVGGGNVEVGAFGDGGVLFLRVFLK